MSRSEIENLLAELDATRREIYRLQAHGVRAAGLRDLKTDFTAVQQSLRLYTGVDGD